MEIFKEQWHDHKYFKAVRGILARHWFIVAWVISFILIGISIYQVQRLADDNQNTIDSTNTALTNSCFQTRTALQSYFQGEVVAVEAQIEQTKATPRSLFPQIPHEQFDALVQQSISQDQERIGNLKHLLSLYNPDTCANLYSDNKD